MNKIALKQSGQSGARPLISPRGKSSDSTVGSIIAANGPKSDRCEGAFKKEKGR